MRPLLLSVALFAAACAHERRAQDPCSQEISECMRRCSIQGGPEDRYSSPMPANNIGNDQRTLCQRNCEAICHPGSRAAPRDLGWMPDAGS